MSEETYKDGMRTIFTGFTTITLLYIAAGKLDGIYFQNMSFQNLFWYWIICIFCMSSIGSILGSMLYNKLKDMDSKNT